jgi:hypothetical protein
MSMQAGVPRERREYRGSVRSGDMEALLKGRTPTPPDCQHHLSVGIAVATGCRRLRTLHCHGYAEALAGVKLSVARGCIALREVLTDQPLAEGEEGEDEGCALGRLFGTEVRWCTRLDVIAHAGAHAEDVV